MHVWIYGPGLGDEEPVRSRRARMSEAVPTGRSAAAIASRIIGMELDVLGEELPLANWVEPGEDPALAGLTRPVGYGTAEAVRPIFFVRDPSARALGRIAGTDTVGLGVIDEGDRRSVFSSAPSMPPELLRALIGDRVHFYADTGDVLYANRSLLAIQSAEAGSRRIRLPRPARVRDLLTGRELHGGTSEFELPLDSRSTSLLGLES